MLPFFLIFSLTLVSKMTNSEDQIYPYHKKCLEDKDCGEILKCINFQKIFDQGGGDAIDLLACDCLVPTQMSSCLCEFNGTTWRRWEFVKAQKFKEKEDKNKELELLFGRDGCYLDGGEICKMDDQKLPDDTDEPPPTHFMCRWGFKCKTLAGADDLGFCRRSPALKLLPSLVLILMSLSYLQIIAFFSSTIFY